MEKYWGLEGFQNIKYVYVIKTASFWLIED